MATSPATPPGPRDRTVVAGTTGLDPSHPDPSHLGHAYLDHAATTPMLPEAVDAMLPWLRAGFGNPSGVHAHARAAREALEDSRDRMAAVLGCQAREIVFTGGGTESLNMALHGVLPDATPDGGTAGRSAAVAFSAIEHDAVRNCIAALEHVGRVRPIELPVDRRGVLDLDATATLLAGTSAWPGRLAAVALMAVNNEVGTVQPVDAAAALVRAHTDAPALIVDAVQALAWLDLRPLTGVADLLALSAHKFGGPKGTGCLVVREGLSFVPLVHGGGQERERRSGTQNVAGIVAMAEAAAVTDGRRAATAARVGSLRDRLVDALTSAIPDAVETSPRAAKVAGNAHLCIEGVHSEELLILLDQEGVSASAGSACASGAIHASPVLLAMGVPKERALGSLRLTLGASTTEADIDRAIAVIPKVVARLRS